MQHVTHVTRVTRDDPSTCAGDCLEVPASWVEEASRLRLEYDEERDYHPQVDTDHDHPQPPLTVTTLSSTRATRWAPW